MAHLTVERIPGNVRPDAVRLKQAQLKSLGADAGCFVGIRFEASTNKKRAAVNVPARTQACPQKDH